MPSPQNRSPEVSHGSDGYLTSAISIGLPGTDRVHNETFDANVLDGNLHQAQEPNRTPKNAMEENKQKAKAVIAASGLSGESTMVQGHGPHNVLQSKEHHFEVNGVAQSRKRSRSGTRIPRHSEGLEKDVHIRTEETLRKIQLEQYLNRQQMNTATMITVDCEKLGIIQSKDEERKRYQANQPLREANPTAIFGPGYYGFGHGVQDISATQSRGLRVIVPGQRKRVGGRKSKELRVSRKDQTIQAEQIDELVPIRLDIEWDKIRVRDTFTWNIHDRVVGVDLFAQQLVEDFKLPLAQCEPLVYQIQNSMQEQISDYHPHIFIDEDALDPHLPYTAYKNDEMRIVIKLNITIGQYTLVDQFEWEINNPMNHPEDFARQMTRDLSLSGEFTTAIAHSIREQSQLFTRSLYVVGHPFDGRPVEDHELQASFQQSPLASAFRPYQAAKEFTPYLYELNEVELEKTELSLSREERRQKRSVNRRGGPALPDLKDRRRTIRTLLVSSVLPSAVDSMQESRIFKRTARSGNGRRGTARDGVDESDDSESDDSSPESPAVPAHLLSGTARTRGMRGAASAAQAAMRANIGRSATPESTVLHHHETRTSGRRIVRDDSSPELQTSLVVKLRLPRQKFQQLLRTLRAKSKETSQISGARPSSRNSFNAAAPSSGVMGPPTSTPRIQQKNLPGQSTGSLTSQAASTPPTSKHGATSQLGRVDATGPPGLEHPVVSQAPIQFVEKL